MSNQPLFTLICDDVRIETSNKLVIIGLYNYVINFQSPVAQSSTGMSGSATLLFALPFLTIVRRWHVTEAGKKAHTELIDPSGKSITISDVELTVPTSNDFYQEIIRIAGMVLTRGVYTIKTTYHSGTERTYSVSFEVTIDGVAGSVPRILDSITP
jgi:hypothetical protein